MRILFIGDIFGRPGRTIVKDRLPGLVREHAIDLVIANGENSAAGFGITPPLAEDLFELGIDVITTGNHVWDKREIVDYFQMADGNLHSMARRLLRPANYHSDLPGWGVYEGTKKDVPYAVINLQGRVFMRLKKYRWVGISMAALLRSSAHTPTSPLRMNECYPVAQLTSRTSA